MKECTQCHIVKPLDDFHNSKSHSGGKLSRCKECRSIYMKRRYSKNVVSILAKCKVRYDIEREHILEQKKEYNAKNRDKRILNGRQYYDSHRDECLKRKREYYQRTKESRRQYVNKRRTRPDIRIAINVSSYLLKLLKGKKAGTHWESFLDFDKDKLKLHLEKQFKPGMTWDNYGEWHIDHKIPVSAFNFTSPNDIDFKRCWSLKNLQPMWAKDNFSKGGKLFKPFQPCLQLAVNE